jgi:Trk-type K+ transport system membrane component
LVGLIEFKAFYKYNLGEISQNDYYQVPVFNPCYPQTVYYNAISSQVLANGTIVTNITRIGGNSSGGSVSHNSTSGPPPSVTGLTGSSMENSLIAWSSYIGTLAVMGIMLFFFGVDKRSKKENSAVIIMTAVLGIVALSAEYVFGLLTPINWLYYLTLFLVVLGMVLMFVVGGRHGN